MVSVREIETRYVHASVEHFDEHFDIPAGWTKGANDFGLSRVGINAFEDVLEFYAAGISASLGCFYHSILTACSWFCAFPVVRLYLMLTQLLLLNYQAYSRSCSNHIIKFNSSIFTLLFLL